VSWEGWTGCRSIWRVERSMMMFPFESVINMAVEELAGTKSSLSSSAAGIANSSDPFVGSSGSSCCSGSAGSCVWSRWRVRKRRL
jgi:hypothetical protein